MIVFRFLLMSTIYFGLLVSSSCTAPSAAPNKKIESVKIEPVKIESDLTLLHQMQGRWQDVKNDESVIEVNGEKFLSIYQDEVMKVHQLEVFEDFPKKCQGKPSKGGLGFFITSDAEGFSYCYQLISLDHGKMHYEALGPVGEGRSQ